MDGQAGHLCAMVGFSGLGGEEMEKATLRMDTANDRQVVVVQLEIGGEARGTIVMDAAETENHIARLARVREHLAEQVPEAPDPNARIEISASHPVTMVGTAAAMREDVFLRVRHPGMGWLTFTLSKRHAKALARDLANYANAG